MASPERPVPCGGQDGGDMLIVVRHAVAVERGRWPGGDLGRPLTQLGERQAEGLLIRLEDFPVERILSGAAVRCLDTVAPLARQRLVPVETVEPLGLAGTTEGLLELVARDDVEDAVLCTHGEVIGALLVALL